MRKLKYYTVLLFTALTVLTNSLSAQTLKLNPKTFTMTIFGTTNVHDFQSKVTQATGELVVSSKEPQSMTIEIPVKGIKSNEKLMDTKTYEAFHADKYPTVIFRLTDTNSLQVNGSDIIVTAVGNMTINGVTKKVSLRSSGKIVKPGMYEFNGSVTLRMTDFKMTPPTAMLGMMKVGDVVILKYTVTFEGLAIN